MIRENLEDIERRINEACARSGRRREDVTLIAVSKTKPVEMIREAAELGQRDFGENRPQELRDKYPLLPPDLRWHMIGQLQRNKVKYVIGRACMIHSVDSLALAQEISEQALRASIVMPVLAEINIAGEASKSGISPEDAEAFIRELSRLEGIKVRGLMTVPPFVENPEDNRLYFRKLHNLSIDIANKNIDNVFMCDLSMGMTGDFEVAVEEGATFVRVGTGIFGGRNYAV